MPSRKANRRRAEERQHLSLQSMVASVIQEAYRWYYRNQLHHRLLSKLSTRIVVEHVSKWSKSRGLETASSSSVVQTRRSCLSRSSRSLKPGSVSTLGKITYHEPFSSVVREQAFYNELCCKICFHLSDAPVSPIVVRLQITDVFAMAVHTHFYNWRTNQQHT